MSTIYGNLACEDPAALYTFCVTSDPPLPTAPWHGRANGFDLAPVGREPGKGLILLRKASLTTLGTTTDHDLTFSGTDLDHKYTLKSVTLLSAMCASPGHADDENAVYYCQVADRRYHLARIPIDKAYNVRAADGSDYLTATKNGGTAWTWAQIVTDLETAIGITVGALPFTPDSTPENLSFWGGAAWDAINDVMDRIACGIKYDPEEDTFSVVRLGVSDGVSSIAQANQVAERSWDGYPVDPVRAWRPEKVRVRFLRRPRPTDGSSPYYTVDVTLTATTGVVTGSFVQLDDDASALAATGTPSNSAALATRADERAADWLRKRGGYERPLLKVYRDFIPEIIRRVPGASVGSVAIDDRGGPMRTEVAARPDKRLEGWRPLSALPPWFPAEAGGGSATVSAWKEPVRVRATGNVTVSSPGTSTFDGVTISSGDRILLPAQSTGSQNGIYTFNGSGSTMTRTADCDTGSEFVGATVYVSEGTTYGNTYWTCTTDATITVGVTSTTWAQTPSASRTLAGYVDTTTQSFTGAKTFYGATTGTVGTVAISPTSTTSAVTVTSNAGDIWQLNAQGTPSIVVYDSTSAYGDTITFTREDIYGDGNPISLWHVSPGNYYPWVAHRVLGYSVYASTVSGFGVFNYLTGVQTAGANGTFTTTDGKTVTVTGGIITAIV